VKTRKSEGVKASEDYHLGQRIAEVADDKILKAAEAWQAYRSYLEESYLEEKTS